MRIGIASVEWLPEEFRDDDLLARALAQRGAEVRIVPWDDPAAGWHMHDLVVVRSTWDYAHRHEEFLTWADTVGERLHNSPSLLRWNTDKTYLADLAGAGFPTVQTTYVGPGGAAYRLRGEVVVKPSVSAGGRETGRFGPEAHDDARRLVAAIVAAGRTAMIQPYVGSVDIAGESALVFIDGEFSHGLRKRAVLTSEGVAPTREDELGAAEAMYDPDLVRAATPQSDEVELAGAVVAEVARRFGGTPLYARVDLVRDGDGQPLLLELEAVEPNLYLSEAPGAAGHLADAILARAATWRSRSR